MYSWQFEAIGTHWSIDIFSNLTESASSTIEEKARLKISEFDHTYSRFNKNSWVRLLAKRKGTYKLPSEAYTLLSAYFEFYKLTSGLFTPLIGQTLVDAGYDEQYSLKQKQELSIPPSWEEIIQFDNEQITMLKPALLDFGACGKGYLVDLVGKLFETNGVSNYCIDAGGDILYKNKNETLKVGLEDPNDPEKVIGIAEINNQSICASSGNRRKWGNFHHTINPKTLTSPDEIIATWVVCDNAILADTLCTCLCLNPELKLYKDYKFECILLYKDYSVIKTKEINTELFIN